MLTLHCPITESYLKASNEISNDAVAGRSGPSDRALDAVQAVAGTGGKDFVRASKSYSCGGMERATRQMPGHRLRRHSRTVSRSRRAFSHRWQRS